MVESHVPVVESVAQTQQREVVVRGVEAVGDRHVVSRR